MSKKLNARFMPCDVNELLHASGLPWRMETGTRHFKLFVGEKFAAIFPKSPYVRNSTGRAHRNAVAQIRRVIREQQ